MTKNTTQGKNVANISRLVSGDASQDLPRNSLENITKNEIGNPLYKNIDQIKAGNPLTFQAKLLLEEEFKKAKNDLNNLPSVRSKL